MTVSVTHKFVSAKSNGTDNTLVQPSNWNDTHNMTCTVGNVLGSPPGGSGTVTEIPIGTTGQSILAANSQAAATTASGAVNVVVGAAVLWFTGSLPTDPNATYAWCNGQAVSRTTYAACFSLLGTSYGVGDGSTTFNLPDLRERVPIGTSTMGGTSDPSRMGAAVPVSGAFSTLGSTAGESQHTLTTAEMPVHNHTATDSGHTHNEGVFQNQQIGTGGTFVNNLVNTANTQATTSGTANITVGNAGSGNAHNVVQPSLVCNWVMRIA